MHWLADTHDTSVRSPLMASMKCGADHPEASWISTPERTICAHQW